MLGQIIAILVVIGAFVWLGRFFTMMSEKMERRTRKQLAILAKNLGATSRPGTVPLQDKSWTPPELHTDEWRIYLREIHYGTTWTPYTILAIQLPPALHHKRSLRSDLLRKLQRTDLKLFRGEMQIKDQVMYFEMPMLLYSDSLRENFESIVRWFQDELATLVVKEL